MTETTQWILWALSILVTIITFMIPLLRAKKSNKFLQSSLNVLQESNKTLSEKISELSTTSEMIEFYIKLKNDITQALESEKELGIGLKYIGALAVRTRLKEWKIAPLPSKASIERI